MLSNVRHRVMLTPVSPPLTRLIHISPSWTIYPSFKIILEMVTVHWIEPQIQCSIQVHCFKKHSVRYELCFKKCLTAWEISESNEWAREKRERTKSWERLLRTTVLFRSPATWTRKARHGTKLYEQWQGPKERARVNYLLKWDRDGGANMQRQLAFSDINLNRRLGRSPRSPCAGVATGCVVKTPRTQLKKQAKRRSIDTCLKRIQNHNFSTSRTQKYHDWMLILQLH